jgi:hypothetical protein
MSDAKIWREKAALFTELASTASDVRVKATLLRLARSALSTAKQMEDSQQEGSGSAWKDYD